MTDQSLVLLVGKDSSIIKLCDFSNAKPRMEETGTYTGTVGYTAPVCHFYACYRALFMLYTKSGAE